MKRWATLSGVLLACGTAPAGPTAGSVGSALPPGASSVSVPASSVADSTARLPGSSAGSVSARASASDRLPSPAELPAPSIVALAKLPEALTPRPTALFKQPSEDVRGKFLWAQSFETKSPRFAAFAVHLADGPIEVPLLERLRAASSLTVTTTQTELRFGRKATIDFFTMGLGGPVVFARWSSPAGRLSVLLVIDVPPKDVPVSEKMRAYYNDTDPTQLAQRLVLGIDPLLFPN